jgi:thiol-disulfide isomerase/thioredoxin
MASPRKTNNPTRTLLLIAGIVAVVAIVGVIVAVVVGGGDDGDDSSDDDPVAGQPVPVVSGVDYDGNEITIDPAADGPTMIALLAHWCPHCNNEIPVLNEWRDSGEIPEGLDIVGVSTGVDPSRPNYPPDKWLASMDWQWPVLADDDGSAMAAYGGTSFPTLIFVDSDGNVFRQLTGEVPIEELDPLADELMALDDN